MALSGPAAHSVLGIAVASADESVATPTTAGANTSIFDARAYRNKMLYLKNTSDKAVDFQVQASPTSDFAEVYNVGAVITLADGSVTPTRNHAILTDYHTYLRVNVKAQGSNATVGAASIFLRAQGD